MCIHIHTFSRYLLKYLSLLRFYACRCLPVILYRPASSHAVWFCFCRWLYAIVFSFFVYASLYTRTYIPILHTCTLYTYIYMCVCTKCSVPIKHNFHAGHRFHIHDKRIAVTSKLRRIQILISAGEKYYVPSN